MRFFRYMMIQLLAYMIDMGSFLVLFSALTLNPIAANVTAKVAGGLFAFIAHRNITFRSNHKRDKAWQARRYLLLCLFNIPLSSMLLLVLLTCMPYTVLAKFMADVAYVLFNYWINKTFVFVAQK